LGRTKTLSRSDEAADIRVWLEDTATPAQKCGLAEESKTASAEGRRPRSAMARGISSSAKVAGLSALRLAGLLSWTSWMAAEGYDRPNLVPGLFRLRRGARSCCRSGSTMVHRWEQTAASPYEKGISDVEQNFAKPKARPAPSAPSTGARFVMVELVVRYCVLICPKRRYPIQERNWGPQQQRNG
jgi:hypothetical protein